MLLSAILGSTTLRLGQWSPCSILDLACALSGGSWSCILAIQKARGDSQDSPCNKKSLNLCLSRFLLVSLSASHGRNRGPGRPGRFVNGVYHSAHMPAFACRKSSVLRRSFVNQGHNPSHSICPHHYSGSQDLQI